MCVHVLIHYAQFYAKYLIKDMAYLHEYEIVKYIVTFNLTVWGFRLSSDTGAIFVKSGAELYVPLANPNVFKSPAIGKFA